MSRVLKGEIYLADLSPTIGSEIAKTRPVLIVSNDINNQYAATVTIVPITSTTEKSTRLKFSCRKAREI